MKIFLCSTSFDLEDLRALAVDRFGDKHEFIHFEDAAFASRRGLHSHDQCIEAVKQADVILCIIDKRYGGKYAGNRAADFTDVSFDVKGNALQVPTAELSISWCELITAYKAEKYVITFARKRTLDEKATRRKNQSVADFKPAHVDNVRVFDLLDWITKQPKDNWIIPFDTAVDFLKKLEKWLEVAADTTVPAADSRSALQRPITVIVEGEKDSAVVRAIASALKLERPISIVVATGKRSLFGNLKVYADAFKDSAGILVLADSDSLNRSDIERQQMQFEQIARDSSRPDMKIVFAVPEIESWFGEEVNAFAPPEYRFRITNERLAEFEESLNDYAHDNSSLREFMHLLKELDGTLPVDSITPS